MSEPTRQEGGSRRHRRPSARRRTRVTAVVGEDVAQALRELAIDNEAALSRLVEQALVEYLSSRVGARGAALLARAARRSGRPSAHDQLVTARRLALLRKRTGRPIRRNGEASDETN